MKRYIVEGTNSVGAYSPYAYNPPFSVFDTKLEYWPYRSNYRVYAVIFAFWKNHIKDKPLYP